MENILYRYNPWWENDFQNKLISRPQEMERLLYNLKNDQIIFLTGLRRIGKTSLMKLLIENLISHQGIDSSRILYISLDDYSLFKSSILDIVEEFRKIHEISFQEKIFLFLDEVTYKKDFEIQLKNLYDLHNAKIFAASSSASLIRQRKWLLTGRNLTFEILPLDFDEYLSFKKITLSKANAHLLDKYFDQYLETGGIPEYVLHGDPAYLNELIGDIILKDIAAINNIRQPKVLQDFFRLLMERAGKQMSLNKIASILGISVDSSRRYFEMFVNTFLIFPVARKGKTNERLLAPKKIYAPDTGIRSLLTGYRDKGSMFENYVFLRLKQFSPEYIYTNQTEIDFILNNDVVVEAKYHSEPLSKKQEKLMASLKATKKYIIRSFNDLTDLRKEMGNVILN